MNGEKNPTQQQHLQQQPKIIPTCTSHRHPLIIRFIRCYIVRYVHTAHGLYTYRIHTVFHR